MNQTARIMLWLEQTLISEVCVLAWTHTDRGVLAWTHTDRGVLAWTYIC